MRWLWAMLLAVVAGGLIGCGDPGRGKHKESLQEIPKSEEKKK